MRGWISSSFFPPPLPPLTGIPLFPWGNISEEEFYNQKQVQGSSAFFTSSRGLRLFTRSWSPASPDPPRALLFTTHGYSDDISWSFQLDAVCLASMGYSVFAMDMEGHGQSDGLRGFLPNADLVAVDFAEFCTSKQKEKEEEDARYLGLPCFLFGGSLAGSICLLAYLRGLTGCWNGAILVAPMCRISDSMMPPWPLLQLLTLISRVGPTWPIVPGPEVRDLTFRDPITRELSKRNPHGYHGKPRLGTARELLRVGEYLSSRLPDVKLPFLVLHGGSDTVTDPAVSRVLYETAKSCDKTFKLYEGMPHAVLQGENEDEVTRVWSDIRQWLEERISRRRSDRDQA